VKHFRLVFAFLAMSGSLIFGVIVATQGVATATQGVATATGPDPAGTVYVSDESTNSIDVFPPGTNGNVAPIRTISGPLTGITSGQFGPDDVKVDSAGDVFSSNFNDDSITEYAPGASGNVAPICTISGSNTGLDNNDDISLASDGTLYVGNFAGNDPVEVFAPGACGNVAPERIIAGALTGLGLVDGLGVDATGTLYVDDTENNSIAVFAPGANGNIAPEYSISGSLTGLGNPDDIVVGFNGEIYVTNGFGSGANSITVFAPGASGNVAPIEDISGSNTDFGNPDDLAVDAKGNMYVTDEDSSVGPAVLEFASGANGNVAPIATIAGSSTTFVGPEGVAVAGPPGTVSASLTSSASSSSITLGTSTQDTVTLSGGTAPTGSLIFKLFGPNDPTCSAAPAYTSPVSTVTGDGSYLSPFFTPTADGTYSWVDLYSGDANNSPVSTACGDPNETVTVSGAMPTSLATSLSGGGQSGTSIAVPENTAVTDSATLSGTNASTATGTVTYDVYSDSGCTTAVSTGTPETITTPGTLPVSGPVTLSTPGAYYWQASYSGDSLNAPSTSECGSEVETVQSTVTTPTCTLTSIAVGPPSQMVFTVQDTGSGLATVKAVRHRNSTSVIAPFSPGTTNPVTVTFTKKTETAGGTAGVKATNEIGKSVFCTSQYKTVKPLRVNSQGFTFKKRFNMLVIQNGTPRLTSVQITLNGTTSTVSLTPGETYKRTLSGLTKSNKMVIEGFGRTHAVAVAAVWGYLK
jgi:sugar lactone lactonase YvrE